MTREPRWLVDGQPGGLVHPDDRGFAYGDGLFETIAWRSAGPRFLDRHLQRLARGCVRLGMPAPDAATLEREIIALAAGASHGTVRLTLTRGRGPRGYAPPGDPNPSRVLAFYPGPVPEPPAGGLAVLRCQTPASINPALAGMKTLNKLDNVLARAELARTGSDEGIMCGASGQVIGATSANVFVVRGGVLLTPDLSQGGVAGIMRSLVLECARERGIATRETCMDVVMLQDADEMFLTNALTGLRPVASYAGQPFPGRQLTRVLAQALRERGVPEACA